MTLGVARVDTPGERDPDEFFFYELEGCLVIDAREGELGRVATVREDGGGLLLEVKNEERTLLVPFVRAFLREVDLQRRRIETELPEGLVEVCASMS